MLEIENLNKSYGDFKALDNLSLSIDDGELYGFVGPNGAGKTTTMKIVSGLLAADSGQIHIAGIDARKDIQGLKSSIGYMPDFFGVYDNLKAIEYMEFFASIYGIDGRAARKLSLDLMELVNLSDKADSYVDGLSRGMKQRLCLARTLIHNPSLLILDEPASGLDPRARFEMKGILNNLREMGKTILISSHILPELAEMCSSVGIIEHGKMLVSGTVDSIMQKMNRSNPIVIKTIDRKDELIRKLKERPDADNISITEDEIYVGFSGDDEEAARLLSDLIADGFRITSFAKEKGSLESVFMQIIKE
ncbi:MAG: ABC transporter ATP-binding protein [Lachnospiraceae bacterium]|jgi:ABC-2 type transport system ATP-binding protein|nr:ABC transporter ATP-binding protein [Lachnospiraceae bacterium]